ncbi:MAG: CocE/NonD family hydrolase [Clostridiales bacterium]|nr:CocE/NonD family hydrolase [Clostridiales bacterium]
MKQWNFYFSGILYGIIRDQNGDGKELYHRTLDVFTNTFHPEEPLHNDDFYEVLCRRKLRDFFESLPEYEIHAKAGEERFTTAGGQVFTRRLSGHGASDSGSYIQREVKFPLDLYLSDGKVYAVQMAGRDYTGVLVLNGMEEQTILKEWTADPVCAVHFAGTYMVPTADGEQLATDVYLPATTADGLQPDPAGGFSGSSLRVPAVLVRTPYGKHDGVEQYYRFVQRGYAVVVQDVRGREDSTGEWMPNYHEVEDGSDTLDWIADQPWSDGNVGMTGGSYLGYVQWAAAASGNPHLKAMLSSVCAGSPFIDLPRRGGCFTSGSMAWNFAMTEKRFREDRMVRSDWEEVLKLRPVRDMARKALGIDVPFLNEWLNHPDYDDFWRKANWRERSCGHVVPALVMSGWFDDNGMGTTEALELIDAFYPAGTYKVVLGPWKHSGNANYDIHGIFMGEHALRYDMDLLCFAWLDHFLKNEENGIETGAPVEYYTLGDNCWKHGKHWPLPEAVSTVWYLDREALTLCKPAIQESDSYDYDPESPAAHIIDVSENELEVPEDYTEEEKRSDILCYTTPVLDHDLTVTGDITAVLCLSSDCPDTDLFVRITDVDEAGTSIKLADGVIDVKYRNSFEKPEFMEPGQVYEVRIRTTKLSNTFKAGHRMRFTVTSSAKNFMFPNSNTENGFDSEVNRVAHNTIYRGGALASHILVPVEKDI